MNNGIQSSVRFESAGNESSCHGDFVNKSVSVRVDISQRVRQLCSYEFTIWDNEVGWVPTCALYPHGNAHDQIETYSKQVMQEPHA